MILEIIVVVLLILLLTGNFALHIGGDIVSILLVVLLIAAIFWAFNGYRGRRGL